MERVIGYWLYIVLGYLSGSALYGYALPRLVRNVDVRECSEDGNPGTYNAFKYGGFACGVTVLIAELMKGALPVMLCSRRFGMESYLFSIVMAAPVIGHAYSAFHGRSGGKAIAVSFGVLIGLFPQIRPLVFLIFFYLLFSLVIKIKEHRQRTLATFMCLTMASIFCVNDKYIVLGILIMSMTVIHKHRMPRV